MIAPTKLVTLAEMVAALEPYPQRKAVLLSLYGIAKGLKDVNLTTAGWTRLVAVVSPKRLDKVVAELDRVAAARSPLSP